MRVLLLAALAALGLSAPLEAMTVQEFVTRGDALQAKGMFALFSDELETLRLEFRPGAKAWRAQVKTAQPPVCAPPKVTLQPEDILALLKQVPPAERPNIDVRTAVIREMNARYRCK